MVFGMVVCGVFIPGALPVRWHTLHGDNLR
jgi:hypothetical protein